MSLLLFIRVLTQWETLLVSAVLMILIPLVTYLASLRPRIRRLQFITPAEKALEEAPAEALE